ncbi:MmcQ/YjbR family DNA-binding protein [Brevibacterium sp.]|uniref:MmcQ/YjbR family DNA-binding protein n=1 Tax=Brevibacterium sp. TaxID=1701 RepID=UPI0028119CB5|nr:MmcQ/YjbR family DNA-binding protein [Brevibacterium sp.]
MDGTAIQQHAADRAEELPGASLEHPFGPEWDVYKVRGKVFMLQTVLDGEPLVIVKADPDDGTALREAYPEITKGYHMNKRHWITLHTGEKIDAQLIKDIVTESYLLVIEKNIPKKERPVDPSAFG